MGSETEFDDKSSNCTALLLKLSTTALLVLGFTAIPRPRLLVGIVAATSNVDRLRTTTLSISATTARLVIGLTVTPPPPLPDPPTGRGMDPMMVLEARLRTDAGTPPEAITAWLVAELTPTLVPAAGIVVMTLLVARLRILTVTSVIF